MSRVSIRGVKEYTAFERSVQFDCEIEREPPNEGAKRWTVPVTIEFLSPDCFRFRMAVNPKVKGGTDPLDLDESAIVEPVEMTVSESDDRVEVGTTDLRIAIGLDVWTFDVQEKDGSSLLCSDRSPTGPREVESLGFSEEQRNSGATAVTTTGTSFSLDHDEHVYGLGEKFTALNKRGQSIESWTVRAGGTESERAYKNVPFFLSTRGYGLFVETTNRVDFEFGDSTTAAIGVDVASDTFEFVFFHGPSMKEVLRQFTALAGRSRMPPKWSFGLWMSRAGYESRDEVETVADRLREEKIPCDVLHFDPQWMRGERASDLAWDREAFPEPASMIEGLHDDGFHVSLWEHPYVAVGTDAFADAAREHYLVEDGGGDPYVLDDLVIGQYRGGIVDFSNPEAVSWWQDKHRRLLEMGVDAFKTDFGEDVPRDGVFENGKTGESMHNLYPNLYNRTVDEVLVDEQGRSDAVTWGRSAWAGGQRYPLYWGGDPPATFDGMASALRGGLSLSLSGFPFWSHDIGGFWGEPSMELYVRWSQFGMLSSHARCHGITPREPWEFGREATDIFRKFAQLRYRLFPYLHTLATVAERTGLPVVRPLVLEYPDDHRVFDIDDEYLLGPNLLVAPVLNADGVVDVYLPEGEWLDYWTGERFDGGRTLHREVALDSIPLFVRAESVIPKGEVAQTIPETPAALTLDVTLSAAGESVVNGQVFDDAAGELKDVVVECDTDRTTLDVEVPESARFADATVSIDGVESSPETVVVNGESISETEAHGEESGWTSEDGGVVVIRP